MEVTWHFKNNLQLNILLKALFHEGFYAKLVRNKCTIKLFSYKTVYEENALQSSRGSSILRKYKNIINFYLNYSNKMYINKKLLLPVTDKYVVEAYYGRFDEMFFQFCDKELAKINIFFLGTCYFLICLLMVLDLKCSKL